MLVPSSFYHLLFILNFIGKNAFRFLPTFSGSSVQCILGSISMYVCLKLVSRQNRGYLGGVFIGVFVQVS